MKRESFYKFITISLLLINIGTLAFLWMSQRRPRPGGPEEGGRTIATFIIHELGFSPAQEKAYMELVHQHRQQMRFHEEAERKFREEMFSGLIDSTQSGRAGALSDSIASHRRSMDMVTYQHFQQVKALCTPEQKQHFNEIIRDVLDRMMHPGPPGGPPR